MLNPPFMDYYSRQSRSPCVTKSRTLYYPYYLAYATGALEKAGFKPELIDAIARKWKTKETVEYAKKGNFDLIVLDSSTPSIFNDLKVAEEIKKVLPNSHITMVNTHVTNLPEWTLNQNKAVDSVCIGEFDNTVVFLAQALSKGKSIEKIHGIGFKKNNKFIHNGSGVLVENLDDLPFVSEIYLRHLGEKLIKEYFYASIKWPEIQLLTARGCPNNCSFCLTPEMPIITNKGLHTIEELVEKFKPKENDIIEINNNKLPMVLSHDGQFHSINAVMKRQYKGEIIVLKVQGIPFNIELTPTHKIYSSRNFENPSLVRANKLTKRHYVTIPRVCKTLDIKYVYLSDFLEIPQVKYKKVSRLRQEKIDKATNLLKLEYSINKVSKLCNMSRETISKLTKNYQNKTYHEYALQIENGMIRYSNSKKSVPQKLELNSDLLRLFGYYLAEGHISKSKKKPNSKTLVFTFNKNEEEYLEDIEKIVKKYFGLDCLISDTKTANQITIYSTIVAHLFEKLFDSGAPKKRIPHEWIYLPEEKQISLLKGYMRGDGFRIPKRIGFNTTSRILAEQLQIILNRFGIYSSLQITKKGKYTSEINGRKFKAKHDRYDVWIYGKAKEKFNSMLDNMFKLDEKKVPKPERWKKTDRYIFVPITKISKRQYSGYVYNFSVKASNSYNIHGVAVSNCNIPMKHSYRARSISNVIKELKYIQKNMPFLNEIMFEDDTFAANKERTIKLCDAIINEGIKLTWSTNARVNTDLETLQKMKQAGCRLVCVGFETPNQNVLNSILKGQTKEMQVDFKKRADQAGILVNGCFILGLPEDTPETMQATIDFAKYLDSNTSQFYPLMVYPGTTAFNWAKEKGYLSTEDFSKWITKEGLHNTVISRSELSAEELVKWCNKARIEFYVKNPKYWLKMVKQIAKDPKEGIRILKGGKTLIRHLGKSVLSDDAKVKK